jgi:putative exosortase-associated protein (TIGR04073 family)
MRIPIALLALVVAAAMFSAGCAGPERKLGRGLNNFTEFARGGEIHRSMEQTALWDGPRTVYTTGFLRGFNRSVARTGIGLYEIVTFPFPSYEPLLVAKHPLYPDPSIQTAKYPYGGLTLSKNPVYPDTYQPGVGSSTIFGTDTSLGFSGGDVAPMVIGSRFRIFEF